MKTIAEAIKEGGNLWSDTSAKLRTSNVDTFSDESDYGSGVK